MTLKTTTDITMIGSNWHRFCKILFSTGVIPVFFLFIISVKLTGQEINRRFQYITSDQGLSQNTVDCILQDSRGFMWFGTWNGLNRYDAYNFKIYKSDNTPGSLSNNFVYSICEDQHGDLWIGTRNGLNRLDYCENRFQRFFHQADDPHSISNNKINVVICDHRGFIWIGTDNGLDRLSFNPNTAQYKITHYTHSSANLNSLPGNEIHDIHEDRSGNIWIGTGSGLSMLDPSGRFSNYFQRIGDSNTISYNSILSIYEDKHGFIWVGTGFGLNRLDPRTGKINQYMFNADDPGSISHFTVNAITEDIEGNLLISTLGGLNRFDPSTGRFYRFPIQQKIEYSLNNEFINSLYCDKQGNVWIGTDKGGINKYNVYQKQFGFLVNDPLKKNTLSHNTINSIFEEEQYLWIGTAGGGLNRYDKKSHTFSNYKYSAHAAQGISSDFITSICRDNSENLWVGTWGGGLNKVISTTGNGIFKVYRTQANPDNSIRDVFISSLWNDKKGFMLIGTSTGVDMFYPEKDRFKHIADNPLWKKRIAEVGCILKDRSDNYWFGTRIGLFKIPADKLENLKETDIGYFVYHSDNVNTLPGNYIISLCQDRKGNIWAGTYGNGISKIEISGNQVRFTNYSEKDGLCNNVVYSILEDNAGNLWLSTDNGLSKFNPSAGIFKNYYVTDGLQSNQFYWSAAFKNKEGKMYFGGIEGVNFFHPDSIKDNKYLPRIAITDFKVFNTSVNIGKWHNKRVILDRIINAASDVYLTYRENVFSIEFSALDYFLPEKIGYKYRMNGVDKDWVAVPATRRFVTYTNLKGGDYVFEVKASNSDGFWNEKPVRLTIHISPPFWATLWFKFLAVFLLSTLTFTYFRYRTRRLHAQKKMLEIMVKERTSKIEEQKGELTFQAEYLKETNLQLALGKEQIEGQKAQLEKQNLEILEQRDKLIELNKHVKLVNQLKLRFFTNISHEFRTPLTLILGPVEKLISTWKGDEESLSTLKVINRNAQRLLQLINQLMEFRKIETGKLELRVSRGDLIKTLENIFSSFHDLAGQRQITYSWNPCLITDDQWFDQEKVENILYNLLSNAFKFTPEKGTISLSVSVIRISSDKENKVRNEKYAEIKVSDSGIGIPKEHLANIFKRFYQVNSVETLKVRGSGIGLSLSRELVRAHKGQISVNSTEGKGTEFIVLLPFDHASFAEKDIIVQDTAKAFDYSEKASRLSEELLAPDKQVPGRNREDQERKPLLVVAEDNSDLREFISESLRNDFRIIETGDGKKAYELTKEYNPELVISDIMMPEMDGLELCSRLKSNLLTSHIPVMLLTARTSVENWIEGLEQGADDYMPKPFDIHLLTARVKNLIESRRKLKRLFRNDLSSDISNIATTQADELFIKKAFDIVEQNFTDSEFGVEKFVEKMCVSHSLLHKKLSALTDQSAGDFITSFRLKKAAQLLVSEDKNISEVAYEVGFNDPKYFSRIFKKHFGRTPTEYSTMSI